MVLKISNLAKRYETGADPVEVLRDVSFEMAAGDTLALEGESGSGKSTLLHLVAGLDRASAGQIEVEGVDITGFTDTQSARLRRESVGLIFQQFNLIPSLNVQSNIAFHARLSGRYDPHWADELTDKIGLRDHLNKYPEALSGGQQQRVAIARALAARSKLLLADEPTGNLDETTADAVLALMLESAAQTHTAILMVTHSTRQAARMRRRLTLSRGTILAEPPSV
ncbi:putative ABC transporter ATP-binding protein [Roseobacter fucihabitans]|uniref:ABC transporter ATP-binding protein n=1 Tax=Roseobacter fucihabitans TaxID=1537242 RepID=A0ABZ2BPP6_9RHOB|nr:ABC transporter ATP-binding protein [Roseobacter litoralis]MBC6965328.1 putative ABC transporter ATP-binding protein [Roseobacter litoralis]MBC6965506.1 putative ABC transporter ATP-binding protein [Roseobacter litoralis]